jgi:hypothetical protein
VRHLLLIWLFLLFAVGVSGYGQNPSRGDDILNAIEQYGQAEVIIAYPGFDAMTALASRFSVSSCDGTAAILCLSPLTAREFISSGTQYRLAPPVDVKGFFTAGSAAEAMMWQSYPTWQHYDTIMHKIADRWPALCTLDTIGFSIMGRAILALKISDNESADEPRPKVMLTSTIHGDEPAGFVLLMRLAEYLACESENEGLASELISRLEIWINALANPDGMFRNSDTMIYPVRANSNGYDLNRNFPDPEVASPPPLQKETLDMIRFMEEKRFVLSANLHSGAEVVNYPWDKWTRLHADDDWFSQISRRYADTVHRYAEKGYMTFLDNGVTRGWEWYTVRGGRQDFVTWGLGGREVTIEIDDIKMTQGSNLEALWQWNHRSLLRFLAEALHGIRGRVTDAGTGDPLPARIFIEDHDSDSSHVYADTLTGYYYRYPATGEYSIIFSCPGYEPYWLEAELSAWDAGVTVDVQLLKQDKRWPDPPVSQLLIWPNPSDGRFRIMPPQLLAGEVTVTLSTTTGSVAGSYRTSAYSGLPLQCNFSGLSTGVYIVSVRKEPYGPTVRGRAVISRQRSK